jgi:hypothetical protein
MVFRFILANINRSRISIYIFVIYFLTVYRNQVDHASLSNSLYIDKQIAKSVIKYITFAWSLTFWLTLHAMLIALC